jgi:sterol desaturase/sphingolipid hydroxylase (fatty acid hydroxylase superfamily)
LGRWFIGPAHHSIHHLKYTEHCGLYFAFWDSLLGTCDPNYEKKFGERLTGKVDTNIFLLTFCVVFNQFIQEIKQPPITLIPEAELLPRLR